MEFFNGKTKVGYFFRLNKSGSKIDSVGLEKDKMRSSDPAPTLNNNKKMIGMLNPRKFQI